MVERPIKKSERQAAAKDEAGANQTSTPESAPENRSPIPQRAERKDRGDKKGRRKEGDERAKPANPALMRGPKPSKPKPPVIEAPAEEADALNEAIPDVSTDELDSAETETAVQVDTAAEPDSEQPGATVQNPGAEADPEAPATVAQVEPVTDPEESATTIQTNSAAEPDPEGPAPAVPSPAAEPDLEDSAQTNSVAEPDPEDPVTVTQADPAAEPSG